MTATWSALALIVPLVEASWRDGRTTRSMRRRMSAEEVDAVVQVLSALPAAIETWSDGNAALRPLRIRSVEEPVRSLSPSGGGRWWVGPDDVRSALDAFVAPGEVDAVFVVWPSDGRLPLCGWGCTIGPSRSANGAGFSSIVSDHWQGFAEREFPEEGFVHEWLHQVESSMRALGVGEDVLPGLHDVDGRTSCRPPELAPFGATYPEHHARTDTWQPWYRDLLTGTVGGKGGGEPGCLGLRPEHWARWQGVDALDVRGEPPPVVDHVD